MKPRIMILTAGFGEGHNAAAHHLNAAFNLGAVRASARTFDVFALTTPRLNAFLSRGYIKLINHAPNVWSAFYAWLDRSNIFPGALSLMPRECRTLAELILREKPSAICATYPVYAFMVERLVQQGRIPAVPFYNIVTDSISINSLWWRAHCKAWFVPNVDSAEVLHDAGIRPESVRAYGFPTPAYIPEHPELAPPALRPASTANAPRVLYIINSGTRGAELTAQLLLKETDWEITCTVGRDHALRQRLEKLAQGRQRPARILGWTDQIPHLLLTHHVVISKAGGATTQEAIAARCPMIVNQIVPGQEEGNYELLRRHGIGALAETPEAVVTVPKLSTPV